MTKRKKYKNFEFSSGVSIYANWDIWTEGTTVLRYRSALGDHHIIGKDRRDAFTKLRLAIAKADPRYIATLERMKPTPKYGESVVDSMQRAAKAFGYVGRQSQKAFYANQKMANLLKVQFANSGIDEKLLGLSPPMIIIDDQLSDKEILKVGGIDYAKGKSKFFD